MACSIFSKSYRGLKHPQRFNDISIQTFLFQLIEVLLKGGCSISDWSLKILTLGKTEGDVKVCHTFNESQLSTALENEGLQCEIEHVNGMWLLLPDTLSGIIQQQNQWIDLFISLTNLLGFCYHKLLLKKKVKMYALFFKFLIWQPQNSCGLSSSSIKFITILRKLSH